MNQQKKKPASSTNPASAADLWDVIKSLKLVGIPTIEEGLQRTYKSRSDIAAVIRLQCLFYAGCVMQALSVASRQIRVRIGFIGCGQIGGAVLNTLLHNGFPPQQVAVCTRLPDKLSKFSSRGVECSSDAGQVASSVHLLFIACPPSQLSIIASDVRPKLRKRSLVVSMVAGVSESKLHQLFGSRLVLRTSLDLHSVPHPWTDDEAEVIKKRRAGAAGEPAPLISLAARNLAHNSDHIGRILKVLESFCQALGMSSPIARSTTLRCVLGAEQTTRDELLTKCVDSLHHRALSFHLIVVLPPFSHALSEGLDAADMPSALPPEPQDGGGEGEGVEGGGG